MENVWNKVFESPCLKQKFLKEFLIRFCCSWVMCIMWVVCEYLCIGHGGGGGYVCMHDASLYFFYSIVWPSTNTVASVRVDDKYNNDRLFIAPHLVRAQSTYKDIKETLIPLTHTCTLSLSLSHTHTHTHTCTHCISHGIIFVFMADFCFCLRWWDRLFIAPHLLRA